MKLKVVSLIICIYTVLSLFTVIPIYADGYEVVKNGLVAWYDGYNNTPSGHNSSSSVWYDLAGNNNITLNVDGNNYFTDKAFHLKSSKNFFPNEVLNVINGNQFTVELTLGNLKKIGDQFATFINSSENDNFALFLRVDGDYIEFKSAKNNRPKISGGLEYFKNSTVTITFKVGGSVKMYVDGVLIGEAKADSKVSAAGALFFGHDDETKAHEAEYRSMRFYNRELTAAEIKNNAKADGTFEREFATVQQPKTNIAGDICVSTYIETKTELNDLIKASAKPANVIFYTNENLEVTDKSFKNAFSTVDGVLYALDVDFIPTFYVGDTASAIAVAKHLESIRVGDANIMSDDPSAVKAAREAYPYIRGIIDFSNKFISESLTEEQLVDIRKTTISNLCHVAVISQSVATQDNVKYLNSRQITTWVCESSKQISDGDAVSMLVSGAYGVITDSYELLFEAAEKYIEPNSITRTPLIIGHRGIPSTMPENTLEGAIEAYNQGADVIEIDLYITSDGVVVINHDGTTSKYNKSVSVEGSTYATLKQLYYQHNGKKYTMPTLEAFLKEFKDKDVMLFLEIKSTKSNIVGAIKSLVEQYGMYSQCAIITFEKYNQLERLKEEYPEMPVGLLASDAYGGHQMFPSIQKSIMKYNTTYNPTYSGYDAEYVRYSVMRGVSTWPWTINSASLILSNIQNGHAGITTNNCDITKNMTNKLIVDIGEVKKEYRPGSTVYLKAEKSMYNGQTEKTDVKYVIIEGSDIAKISGNKLVLDGEGTVTLMAVYTEKYDSLNYSIYSQPIALNVLEEKTLVDTDDNQTDEETGDSIIETENTETVIVDETDVPQETDKVINKSCKSVVATSVAIVGIVAVFGAAIVIKKKD